MFDMQISCVVVNLILVILLLHNIYLLARCPNLIPDPRSGRVTIQSRPIRQKGTISIRIFIKLLERQRKIFSKLKVCWIKNDRTPRPKIMYLVSCYIEILQCNPNMYKPGILPGKMSINQISSIDSCFHIIKLNRIINNIFVISMCVLYICATKIFTFYIPICLYSA